MSAWLAFQSLSFDLMPPQSNSERNWVFIRQNYGNHFNWHKPFYAVFHSLASKVHYNIEYSNLRTIFDWSDS